MLLSMQHNDLPIFPEYRGGHDIDIRNLIIDHAIKKSFKIFVGANKDKNVLIEKFGASDEKIVVQSYLFTLPSIFEKNKDLNYKEIFNKFDFPLNKKFFIYPAQFWAHKNHKYILDIAKQIKKNKKYKELYFIFTGFDKGNLKYIKDEIKINNLEEYIKILNFVDDYQLISLYQNCFGVIMPTYIGPTTIPIYESFYFKKNIFFTKGLCDDELKNYITEINIEDINSFFEEYDLILQKPELNEKKIEKARLFFDNHCNETKVIKNFSMVFKKFQHFRNMWS